MQASVMDEGKEKSFMILFDRKQQERYVNLSYSGVLGHA